MQPKYRELTVASVVGGVLFGAILNMGICFAGLQIGFTIVGSTVAAIIGFGLLRGILRRGSILEVNIFQTVASSVNTVNAGVIFTVPVLFLLGMQDSIDYTALVLAASAGSLLGVVMIIPLRKQIIDYERLRFPEGVAVATILKAPGAGVHKAILLASGIGVALVVQGLATTGVIPADLPVGEWLGAPAGIRLVFAVSLLTLGAGYLAGRPGLVVLYGTLLNFWVLIPFCVAMGWVPEAFGHFRIFSDDYETADEFARPFREFTSNKVGIGMILGGAIAGIVVALPALKTALASLRSSGIGGTREEMPISVLGGGMAVGLVVLLVTTKLAGGDTLGWGTVVIATVVAAIWLWVAGLVVAQTTGRTDWSPLSGLALIAIVIMLVIMGTEHGVVPAVTVGTAVCVATSMCADMMADLKTGYLVGGRPLKQQIAQIATCWIGPGVAILTVILLWKAFAFGPNQVEVLHARAVAKGDSETVAAMQVENVDEVTGAVTSSLELPPGVPSLGAPQAAALQSAVDIVRDGNVPLGKYLTGAVLGLLVSLLVSPGIGVMVGLSLYLPFEYMVMFGLGGITNILVTRARGARWAEDTGVPIAAGLIVGDALVNVTYAIFKVATSVS